MQPAGQTLAWAVVLKLVNSIEPVRFEADCLRFGFVVGVVAVGETVGSDRLATGEVCAVVNSEVGMAPALAMLLKIIEKQ